MHSFRMRPWGMVKDRLTIKLFLILLMVVILVMLTILLLSRWNFKRGFTDYLSQLDETQLTVVIERLEAYYKQYGSWQSLRPYQWRLLIERGDIEAEVSLPPPHTSHSQHRSTAHGERSEYPHQPNAGPSFGAPWPRPDRPWLDNDLPWQEEFHPPPYDEPPAPWKIGPRLNLFNLNKERIIGMSKNIAELKLHPLKVDNVVVGWVGLETLKAPHAANEIPLIQSQDDNIYLIILLILSIATIISIMLARRLLQPINELTLGVSTMAQGDFDVLVTEKGEDEIGQLSRDFNRLAKTLSANESARRRWVADISHELRTPLAVLRGEIEALQDGVRQCNEQSLQSLHSEIVQLNKLVDDLYQLALSDMGALDYHKESVDIAELLERIVLSHQSRFEAADLELVLNLSGDNPIIVADIKRLTQLFENLLENCRRYTDAGGRVEVTCTKHRHDILIDIEDSSPPVSSTALPKLFERLYREDKSRNRAKGGAGLGLAIVRNIIEAHQGAISAGHSGLGGLHLNIKLPINKSVS